VTRLNAATNEGLKTASIKASLAKLGSEPLTGSPQDFAAFIASEGKKWADVVKRSGVKFD
jgi:tripartite-type tricarboxylate transporter receptor subunit TctC